MYSVTEEYAANVAEPVRMSRIYGQLRTKSGNVYEINNSDIESGSLSIVSKLNKKGDFRPGGVYSSTLSISLNKFGDISKDLDRARILLYYDLFRGVDSEEYDRIPLGSYWVNGSSVKRNFEVVSFKAYDDMINFDYSAVAMTDTLYNLAVAACSACGIVLRTTQDVFESMPNGTMAATINTARVQNWRDLLMYIGIATSSFARINRTGGLEFVPLTCEKNDGGVIIPVREIMDNVRGKTEFSDSTERIVKLTMRRNGVLISSTKVYQTAGSEVLSTLEISDNPLFSSLTDAEVSTALNNMLVPLVECLNRTFDVDVISGDPALEVGDYVRLRGGAIDTVRGYATGMITYQAWRYRGDHTIKCSLPATVARDESAIPATMDDTETTIYRQTPKSQLEKRIDALEADMKEGGSASLGPLSTYTYLTDNSIEYNGTTYTIEKNDSGLITKIANDKGGEFSPEIGGDITDVAFHNAVFTAVAMMCSYSKSDNAFMLYDSGNEFIDVTGGWEMWHNSSATATESKNSDHMLIKSENTSGMFAFVFCATANPIDITVYKSLHFEVIAPTTNASDYSDYGISTSRVNNNWSNLVDSGYFGRFDARTEIVMDIAEYTGLHYINMLVDKGNELKIYRVWLER